jgi:hypothetical protein
METHTLVLGGFASPLGRVHFAQWGRFQAVDLSTRLVGETPDLELREADVEKSRDSMSAIHPRILLTLRRGPVEKRKSEKRVVE